MAGTFQLDAMSVEEKLQAMEALWDDLCRRAGGVPSPEWHANVLAERQVAYERGDDPAQDWEEVKKRIKNKV